MKRFVCILIMFVAGAMASFAAASWHDESDKSAAGVEAECGQETQLCIAKDVMRLSFYLGDGHFSANEEFRIVSQRNIRSLQFRINQSVRRLEKAVYGYVHNLALVSEDCSRFAYSEGKSELRSVYIYKIRQIII